jgi:hypothetical protein
MFPECSRAVDELEEALPFGAVYLNATVLNRQVAGIVDDLYLQHVRHLAARVEGVANDLQCFIDRIMDGIQVEPSGRFKEHSGNIEATFRERSASEQY